MLPVEEESLVRVVLAGEWAEGGESRRREKRLPCCCCAGTGAGS